MATTYLYKTLGTPTDGKKYTFSLWVKRGILANQEILLSAGTSSSDGDFLVFRNTDQIEWQMYHSGNVGILKTNRLFRDSSAWYHIQIAYDSANVTAGDRMKMYINGVEETSFATDTQPTLNLVSRINSAVQHNIGYDTYGLAAGYFTGSLAHTHFADGQAYAPTVFGEVDSTSGIWVAKTGPSVTYGNNGFFLKFQDTAAFGDDSSGNTNDFALSGTMTQTKDTPDNNFCTFNPLDNYYQASTFANGNNTVTTHAGNYTWNTATIGLTSGKWYWECKGGTNISQVIVAICSKLSPGSTTEITSDAASITMEMGSGGVLKGGVSEYSGTGYTTSNVCGIAMDLDNNKYYLALDNVWKNSGVPTSGATGTGAVDITTPIPNTGFYFPAQADPSSSLGGECFWNFGNGYFGTTAVTSAEADGNGEGQFEYAPPSGYFAICTNNLGSES